MSRDTNSTLIYRINVYFKTDVCATTTTRWSVLPVKGVQLIGIKV